jgi:hypothetical protein
MRRYQKCGSSKYIDLDQGDNQRFTLAFKYPLQLNDYCSWTIRRAEKLKDTRLFLHVKATLNLAELLIVDTATNKTLLSTD